MAVRVIGRKVAVHVGERSCKGWLFSFGSGRVAGNTQGDTDRKVHRTLTKRRNAHHTDSICYCLHFLLINFLIGKRWESTVVVLFPMFFFPFFSFFSYLHVSKDKKSKTHHTLPTSLHSNTLQASSAAVTLARFPSSFAFFRRLFQPGVCIAKRKWSSSRGKVVSLCCQMENNVYNKHTHKIILFIHLESILNKEYTKSQNFACYIWLQQQTMAGMMIQTCTLRKVCVPLDTFLTRLFDLRFTKLVIRCSTATAWLCVCTWSGAGGARWCCHTHWAGGISRRRHHIFPVFSSSS